MRKLALLLALMMLTLLLCGCSVLFGAIAEDEAASDVSEEVIAEDTPAAEEPAAEEPAAQQPTAEVGLEVGKLAPDFTVATVDGGEVTLSELRGQPVFLNFWATWCGPCVGEMPHMQTVYETYDGLTMLAVNVWDEGSDIQGFLEENGYTFPVGIDTGDVGELYEVQGIPTTFILDKNGVIVFSTIGSMDESTMIAAVEDALS